MPPSWRSIRSNSSGKPARCARCWRRSAAPGTKSILYYSSIRRRKIGEATKRLGEELSLNKTEISEAISRELANIASEIVTSFPDIGGLVLTGGDTAKAVCSRLNMNRMQLHTEVETGLPLGILRDAAGTGKKYWTVTKAGGFGGRHSLANVLKYMSGEDE
ncbi:nucleotide-binding domain containing protein [Paenibacillus sp. JTLBN-2024]